MILLDTQAVYWGLSTPGRLGPAARGRINSSVNRYVSSISHVEFRIKAMNGKLHLPEHLDLAMARTGLLPLPFTAAHAVAMERFTQLRSHDPFDRMLVAQAAHERLDFLTADRALLALGEPWIVDATK